MDITTDTAVKIDSTSTTTALEATPKIKIDKYAVQEWAVQPLKELRETQREKQQRIKRVHMDKGRRQVVIDLEQADSDLLEIRLTVFQNGILYFKARNPKNTWDFQLDDVVGPLNLEEEDSLEALRENEQYYTVSSKHVKVRIFKQPFSMTFLRHDKVFLNIHSLFCDGVVSAQIQMPSPFIYGIPEHPEHFNLQDTTSDKPYSLYNLDRYLWPIHSKGSLYGSAPIILSHNEENTTGFFWRNSTETYVDIKKDVSSSDVTWLSEQGEMEFVLFADSSVHHFYKKLADVVGYSLMPQLFSLGYQHSRYSFKDQEDVQDVDSTFDKEGIPYDVIYLDIDHCDKKRYFSFDPVLYTDVDAMVKKIEAKSRKIVTIVDPHVLIDPDYYVYSESKDKLDFFIKKPDQSDFEGVCWPGPCHWLDFLNEDVRQYWAKLYSYEKYKHSTHSFYTWNDMNEPAVFKGDQETMSKSNIHTVKHKNRHYQAPHTFCHNLYGYSQAQASFEGLRKRDSKKNEKRPLVLTRSWWIGTQKHAAIWTADSEATWEYLNIHTPMLLTFSSVGLPFCGGDVGGFEGNPTEELHVRWYQAGAFQPFFRGHSSTFCKRREPWLYSSETCSMIRKAIRTRYEFLAYWYTEFYKHQTSGMPVMRALWQNFPHRRDLFSEEQLFMIGNDILVSPIVSEGQTTAHLKNLEGRWYDYNHNFNEISTSVTVKDVPLDVIPVYFRGGSAVLLYQILSNEHSFKSSEDIKNNCPLYLVLSLDHHQKAHGNFFMDDGSSYNYEKNGQFCVTSFTFNNGKLNVDVQSKYGDIYWKTCIEKVIICGFNNVSSIKLADNIHIKNKTITVTNLAINLNKQGDYNLF